MAKDVKLEPVDIEILNARNIDNVINYRERSGKFPMQADFATYPVDNKGVRDIEIVSASCPAEAKTHELHAAIKRSGFDRSKYPTYDSAMVEQCEANYTAPPPQLTDPKKIPSWLSMHRPNYKPKQGHNH